MKISSLARQNAKLFSNRIKNLIKLLPKVGIVIENNSYGRENRILMDNFEIMTINKPKYITIS